ncbi:hypothetical protein EVAR_67654_1 [Eumeta japonica]|uniref:Uncharacterized protein n=1 Tax=Eumeta variegata TaxID=151549 RepID=A0A4C1ZBT0_EUMVA|nr:hypothetical protein EVAR_67654_1 [Eumeta japonica]
MYGSESWVWQKKKESRINEVEMRSLRSMCGVSRKDRCRNSDVRERCGLKKVVVTRVEGDHSFTKTGPSKEGIAAQRAAPAPSGYLRHECGPRAFGGYSARNYRPLARGPPHAH